MRHYISIILLLLCVLACNNWNREKLQPFAVLELSKSEYNLTFGDLNIGGGTIDFGGGTVIVVEPFVRDTIIIQNTGSTPLIIDSITSSHPLIFWVEGGTKQKIIPPNSTEKLILTLAPHDFVTDYTGEVRLYSNHTGGVKVIPVKAHLDCSADLINCGGGAPEGGCIWPPTITVPINDWYYSTNGFDCASCHYNKGFDIRIIAIDTITENITVEWQQHSDISYEIASIKAVLGGSNTQTSSSISISPNMNLLTFHFYLSVYDIQETSLSLEFDTYKDGIHIIYYSPIIYMCI